MTRKKGRSPPMKKQEKGGAGIKNGGKQRQGPGKFENGETGQIKGNHFNDRNGCRRIDIYTSGQPHRCFKFNGTLK